jgi:two-component system, sensor histidine kinase and response regulator
MKYIRVLRWGLVGLFWLLYGLVGLAEGQSQADSLAQRLAEAADDTSKVMLLHQLAWNHLATAPEVARAYTEQGLALARKLGFGRGEVRLLNRLADYHSHRGDHDSTIQYASQSLKLAEKLHDLAGEADAYVMLGIVYANGLAQYQVALDYDLRALKLYERLGNQGGLASTYNLLADVEAKHLGRFARAHAYSARALALAHELGNPDFLGWCLAIRGQIYQHEQKLDSALLYLQESSDAYERANDLTNQVVNGTIIGTIYNQQGKPAAALAVFNQQLATAKALNARALLKGIYGGLALAHAAQGSHRLAYENHVRYALLQDSLMGLEMAQKVAITRAEYEQDKQTERIASLEKERQQADKENRTNYTIIAASFVAVLVILFLIGWNNRQKRRANEALQAKNEQITLQAERLQQVNATKDKLFSILGHDLRGPVASLNTVLDMVAEGELPAADFMAMLPELRQNVGSVQETLDNLLQWAKSQMNGLQYLPKSFDLGGMLQKKVGLFAETAKQKQIGLAYEVPPQLHVYADQEQVRLILRNLVNNALKFTPAGGRVTISARPNGPMVEVSVADTGVGMSPEQLAKLFVPNTHFSTFGTAGEQGTGLGLLLCKEMAELNGGKISVVSQPGQGSTFAFSLPAGA